MKNFKEKLKDVKAFVFDVDGVFTNGFIYVDGNGLQMRTTNVKDGYAVHYASKIGFPIAIITGGRCKSIISRFNDLGVKDIYIEASDKTVCFDDFLTKYNLKPKNVLYMGDDLPDICVLKDVAIAACPKDAVKEVKEVCNFICTKDGGKGAVRELCDFICKNSKHVKK